MIECQKLWTHECDDVHIGTRLEEDFSIKYMNLGGPQYLQIFRTSIRTNFDELNDGSWLDKARAELVLHFHAIDEHLALAHGLELPEFKNQVVGEGSGPGNRGMRPIRIMHGLVSFKERPDYDPEWRPGVLYLKSRLLNLFKPWAPLNQMTGGDMEYVRESCWMSEVALGFRDDGRWDWKPYRMADAAEGLLEDAATWGGKDFP